jgi:hypothetical protein
MCGRYYICVRDSIRGSIVAEKLCVCGIVYVCVLCLYEGVGEGHQCRRNYVYMCAYDVSGFMLHQEQDSPKLRPVILYLRLYSINLHRLVLEQIITTYKHNNTLCDIVAASCNAPTQDVSQSLN